MKHDKRRRILAATGIILLLSIYILNLVLALIGTEWSRQALKGTMILSVAFPILLYAFLVLIKKNPTSPDDQELTPEQRKELYRLLEEDKFAAGADLTADDPSDAAESAELSSQQK